MRTGVYGGTFNPIHMGHLHILREFIRRLSLNRVLLIPTRIPPHKQAQALANGVDRLAMCTLAAQEIWEAPVEISNIELIRPGRSYTANTLEELSCLYPEDDFFLLMGEDMFLTVDKWYRPEIIFSLTALCGSPRSEEGLGKLQKQAARLERVYGARCFVENIPWLDVSSTQIREKILLGESLAGLVPPGVEEYIREHALYLKS